jgi:hypothetical protein
MEKAFKAFNVGTGKIDLSHHQLGLTMMRSVEIYCKEDGSVKDEPTFSIVMTSPFSKPVFGEISLEMLNEGLNEIGFEIIRKQK